MWPALPLAEWRDTYATLHMWMQMVGKTRLALAPRQNHWWHVVSSLTARGLTTTPMPYGDRTVELTFDFVDHALVAETNDGAVRRLPLRPRSVADFYREYRALLADLGVPVKLWPVPVEADHQIPFPDDRMHATYDPDHAHRFFQVLLQADRVLKRFQGRFLGKSSPVHFFWGVMDLALTRFNGRRAPAPKETEWWVLREASSHEEISFGFWPGSGSVQEPAFYAYVRPEPAGIATATIRPGSAYYTRDIANFILPYEAIRSASSPDAMVLEFCQSAYDVAADLAGWDRASLDRPPSEWS